MNEKTSQFTGKHKLDGTWVSALGAKIGLPIYERFAVCEKPEAGKTAKGDAFVTVVLADKTGHVKLKIWAVPRYEVEKTLARFEVGRVYVFEAQVREYKGRAELHMSWPSNGTGWPWPCETTDFFEEDFCDVPSDRTVVPIAEMLEYVGKTIEAIKHDGYRLMLMRLFTPELTAKFERWPAAKKFHHACIGGLLQHVFEMLKMAETVIALNPKLNADLLRTAIILHDIGKLDEYTLGMQIGYNEDAFAVGHMVIAIKRIMFVIMDRAIGGALDGKDFFALFGENEKDLTALEHLIMSHHGPIELGHGSAVSPKTPEAVALYHLDLLSSKVNESIWKDAKPPGTIRSAQVPGKH